MKEPQHYTDNLKITLLVLLWYNSDVSFPIGYRYLNRTKIYWAIGGGPRPPSKYAHARMEQFTVPCAWSSNRKGSVSERLTRLQTALCDILYKRLRNTLNYLLTYLHVDVAMLLQQQIE